MQTAAIFILIAALGGWAIGFVSGYHTRGSVAKRRAAMATVTRKRKQAVRTAARRVLRPNYKPGMPPR